MIPEEILYRIFRKLSKQPIIKQLRQIEYNREFGRAVDKNLFRGVYESFEQLQCDIPATKAIGYDHDAPAQMYLERLRQVYPADYPVMFWMQKILPDCRRVFDFGGHVGVARYAFHRYLGFPDNLHWMVCDMPLVVEQGRKLAREKQQAHLDFTTEISDANACDLFFASGSLQYLEQPLSEMLAGLLVKPKYVLVNLLPLHEKYEYVTLQNIGTAFCPYKIFNRERFVQGMQDLGYCLNDGWRNAEKSCSIPFYDEYSLSCYWGLYFSLDK